MYYSEAWKYCVIDLKMLYTEFKTCLYIVWTYPLVDQIQQETTLHYQLRGIASAYAYYPRSGSHWQLFYADEG